MPGDGHRLRREDEARARPTFPERHDRNPETGRHGRGDARAPLWDVPVLWPGGGGFIFTSGLARGDQVWLSFSERGLDLWKQDWALADPPPFTMFEMRDAVAHPIGAQEIVPVEGTSDGELSEVTPQASGSRTRVDGATLQSVDGSVFVRVADDEIKLQIGSWIFWWLALSITSAGFEFTGGAVTHNGTNIGDDHVHSGVMPRRRDHGRPAVSIRNPRRDR